MSVYTPPTASEIWVLKNMVLELCWLIEKLPTSPEQTALVSKAAAIHSALQDLLFDNCELRTEEPTRSGPRVIVGYSGPDPEKSCFDEPDEPDLEFTCPPQWVRDPPDIGAALARVYREMAKSSVSLDAESAAVLDEHFWDMI